MIRPEFSEFTFGYAFTENFTNGWLAGPALGVPIFPSLTQEGRPGGGFDVAIPTFAEPIFVQFKIPQVVTRRSRLLPPGFRCPYYRMHIEPGARSVQHRALLEHAARGHTVYYVCSAFDRMSDLNTLFRARRVPDRCAYFEPTDIGQLSDQPHFVAYQANGNGGWLFSEPKQVSRNTGATGFRDRVRSIALERAQRVVNRDEFFSRIALEIIESVERIAAPSFHVDEPESLHITDEPAEPRFRQGVFLYERLRVLDPKEFAETARELSSIGDPLERLTNLAAFVFDSQVILIGHNQ